MLVYPTATQGHSIGAVHTCSSDSNQQHLTLVTKQLTKLTAVVCNLSTRFAEIDRSTSTCGCSRDRFPSLSHHRSPILSRDFRPKYLKSLRYLPALDFATITTRSVKKLVNARYSTGVETTQWRIRPQKTNFALGFGGNRRKKHFSLPSRSRKIFKTTLPHRHWLHYFNPSSKFFQSWTVPFGALWANGTPIPTHGRPNLTLNYKPSTPNNEEIYSRQSR